jgi:repressor LexA
MARSIAGQAQAKRATIALGAHLRMVRERLGISKSEAAEKAGVDVASVRRWELGKMGPMPDHLESLAELYGTTVDSMLEAANRASPPGGLVPEIRIKGYVAAGDPRDAYEVDLGGVAVPGFVLQDSPNAFGLTVSGDSLEGDGIHTGDLLVVDPDAGLQMSKIYVVRMRDGSLCARHLYVDDGHVRLKASNKKYEDIKASELDLVGRVVWHMRKM